MTFLNMILPWFVTLCIVLLSLNYPVRKYCQRHCPASRDISYKGYRFLRKSHRVLGILTIILTFLHCRLSSAGPGMNIGKISFLILHALSQSHLFRNTMKKKWIILHRMLAVLLWVTIIVHIVQEVWM